MASAVPPSRKTGVGKFSGLILIAFIVGLYFFQNKAVMPFVEGVVQSDAFDADTSDIADKDRSKIALTHCVEFVRDNLGLDHILQFGSDESKAWEVTSGRYLVSSYVLEQDESGKQVRKNFACNVQYTGGDEMDQENWTLQGLDVRDL
jgi:hypothetical protein